MPSLTLSLPLLGEFNSQDFANTVWAFATAGFKAPRLFDAIADASLPLLGEFSSQNLANMAWAFATADVKGPRLFDAITDVSFPRLGEFNAQNIANTAWALACAGSVTSDPASKILHRVINIMSSFEPAHLSQLYQFWLFARIEQLQFRPLEPQCERALREAYGQQAPQPSQLQHEVSAALSQLGWAHNFEHVTEEGLSLDLAQPVLKQAVEVDGPSHYLRETGTGRLSENGATQFKSRLLQGLGWTLVRVPYFEWDCQMTDEDKQRYLQAKLSSFELS